jgi:hypothetical protein
LQAPDRIVRTLYGLVALTGLTLHASRARRAARHPADPEGPFVRNRLSLLPLLLTLLVGLSVPATAGADYKSVYKDCSDGNIDGTYTAKELKQALDNQEANTGDYSECSDAIYRAQQALAKGDGASGGGGTTGSGTTGGGTGGGTTAGGATTPSTGGDTNGGSGTTDGSGSDTTDPSASVPATDARNADLAEKQAALVAATQAAEREAGARAADLKDAAVPAAALELGASSTTLPLPLLLTLVACVVAACIAGGTSGLQALRRRRGR